MMAWILAATGVVAMGIGAYTPFTHQDTVVAIPYLGTMLGSTFTSGAGVLGALVGLASIKLPS